MADSESVRGCCVSQQRALAHDLAAGRRSHIQQTHPPLPALRNTRPRSARTLFRPHRSVRPIPLPHTQEQPPLSRRTVAITLQMLANHMCGRTDCLLTEMFLLEDRMKAEEPWCSPGMLAFRQRPWERAVRTGGARGRLDQPNGQDPGRSPVHVLAACVDVGEAAVTADSAFEEAAVAHVAGVGGDL